MQSTKKLELMNGVLRDLLQAAAWIRLCNQLFMTVSSRTEGFTAEWPDMARAPGLKGAQVSMRHETPINKNAPQMPGVIPLLINTQLCSEKNPSFLRKKKKKKGKANSTRTWGFIGMGSSCLQMIYRLFPLSNREEKWATVGEPYSDAKKKN